MALRTATAGQVPLGPSGERPGMLLNVLQCPGQRTTQHETSVVPVLKNPGTRWIKCKCGGISSQVHTASCPRDCSAPRSTRYSGTTYTMLSYSVKKTHFEMPGQHEGKKGKLNISRPSQVKASNNFSLVKCLNVAKHFRKINGHTGKEVA